MITRRQRIEDAIENWINVLDKLDGDPDMEVDPVEEQHDDEPDLTWSGGSVPPFYIVAERARRKAKH